MRRLLILCVFLWGFCPPGGPFVKNYKTAPLAQVLHDIETHFSLQILYRPQDIATAATFTGSINTSDYQTALRQVLGERLTFTVQKNMVIITAKPPSSQTKTSVPTSSHQSQTKTSPPKPTVQTENPNTEEPLSKKQEEVQIDTTSVDYVYTKQNEIITDSTESETSKSVEFQEQEAISLSQHIDSVSIVEAVDTADFATAPKQIVDSTYNFSMRHTFQTAISVGYGSELMARMDFRYGFYFHKNWGVSGGLNFAYASKKEEPSWQKEVRIGLPVALNTRWSLSSKWGIHAALGAITSFPVYSEMSSKSVDVIPFIEADAMLLVSAHIDLLFGLYTQLSATSISPWSIGAHIGILVGK